MPRFKVNRWWVLILTLSLACVYVASMSTRATAGPRMIDDGGRTNLGGAPPPGSGDPDIPMSSVKRARQLAGSQPTAGLSTVRAAGDGMAVDSVMMWHFRVVLQGLRLWGFVRF